VRARLAELRNKSKTAATRDASISTTSDSIDGTEDGRRSASPAMSVQEDASGLISIQAEITKAKKSGKLDPY
jgi:hypothetical protein